MRFLKIQEHFSTGYRLRTQHNADSADLTIAIAMDFSTAGERLTKSVAVANGEEKYLPCYFTRDAQDFAQELEEYMHKHNFTSLNIAGNGIYTMDSYGYNQEDVNKWMLTVLTHLKSSSNVSLDFVVSGGQSGVDFAGGVAATVLDIPCTMTLPRGFKQRWEDGKDVNHTKFAVQQRLMMFVRSMKDA
ncbi:hypothetical protein [Vibrio phage RYC]|nr:hypothetical protein [Vibrio phage RYC]